MFAEALPTAKPPTEGTDVTDNMPEIHAIRTIRASCCVFIFIRNQAPLQDSLKSIITGSRRKPRVLTAT